jgi:hypothetical protein
LSVFASANHLATTLESRKDRNDQSHLYDKEPKLPPKVEPPLDGPLAWLWITTPEPLLEPWTEIMATPDWDCLTMHTFVLCPQFFCLLKPEARVCTQRWLKMS